MAVAKVAYKRFAFVICWRCPICFNVCRPLTDGVCFVRWPGKVFRKRWHLDGSLRGHRCYVNHLGLLMIHYHNPPPPNMNQRNQSPLTGKFFKDFKDKDRFPTFEGRAVSFFGGEYISLPWDGIFCGMVMLILPVSSLRCEASKQMHCNRKNQLVMLCHAAFSEGCASQRPKV